MTSTAPQRRKDPKSVLTSQLLRTAAHDLRAPATAVRGYLRMLLDGRIGSITPEQAQCIEIALKSAGQLAELGSTVEKAAKVLEQLNVEVLDLRDIWTAACESNRTHVLAESITIKEKVPPVRISVCADRTALGTLIDQILARALHAAGTGGEIHADLYEGKQEDAILKIVLPQPICNDNEAARDSLLNLREQVFAQGGTLTFYTKDGQRAEYVVSLPAYTL